jgi:hypothetical protein
MTTSHFYVGMQSLTKGWIFLDGQLFANVYRQDPSMLPDKSRPWVLNRDEAAFKTGFEHKSLSVGPYFVNVNEMLLELQQWFDQKFGKIPPTEAMAFQKKLIPTKYRTDNEPDSCNSVAFEERSWGSFGVTWAIISGSSCLNKDGQWEYEPMPSSRDDEFFSRCRFTSVDEAVKTLLASPEFDKITMKRIYAKH